MSLWDVTLLDTGSAGASGDVGATVVEVGRVVVGATVVVVLKVWPCKTTSGSDSQSEEPELLVIGASSADTLKST